MLFLLWTYDGFNNMFWPWTASNILQNNEMEGPAVKVYEIVVGFKPRVLNQAFHFSPTQNWEWKERQITDKSKKGTMDTRHI